MAIPDGEPKVTVNVRRLALPDGTLYQGRIVFTAPDLVTNPVADEGTGGEATLFLQAGTGSIGLTPNDVTGMDPQGWQYRVDGMFTNAPNWTRYIALPSSPATVELMDIVEPDPVQAQFATLINPSSLGGAALLDVGQTADTVAAGDDPRFAGGGTPSTTVVAGTTFGQSSTAGTATAYSRGDHGHGTPAVPRLDQVGTPQADVAMGSHKLTGLANGASAQDAAAFGQIPTAGTGAGNYTVGNDTRLSDSRTPAGSAGGDLSGTFPNPSVAKIAGVAVSGTAASGKVLTASSSSAASWQTPSGGGGGVSIRTASVRITDDDLSGLPSASSWAVVLTSASTPLQASITASAGDRIRVCGRFMRNGAHFLDWVLLDNTGTIRLYATSESGTAPTEGNPSMYPSLSFSYVTGTDMFTVASGDVDGSGKVTIALAHQGTASGIVYAHATYPWRLRLENIGPEPA